MSNLFRHTYTYTYKKHKGDCSRRINIQHRLVYQILDEEKTVKVIRMWIHYEQRLLTQRLRLHSPATCNKFKQIAGIDPNEIRPYQQRPPLSR